jgi:ionotropic glutamate receptor
LAVAALTINHQREAVIDFTDPFLNLGISILYKKPKNKTPDLFSFLSPLSTELWMYMSAAFIGKTFLKQKLVYLNEEKLLKILTQIH